MIRSALKSPSLTGANSTARRSLGAASMPAVAGFYGAPVTKVLLVASVAATCLCEFSPAAASALLWRSQADALVRAHACLPGA